MRGDYWSEVESEKNVNNNLNKFNVENIIKQKFSDFESIRLGRFVKTEIQKEFESFDKYIWGFVNGKPINNKFTKISEIPTQTKDSEKISKDLKKRGMNFVGPTIIYAYMQAIGMVNDHEVRCFRHKQV